MQTVLVAGATGYLGRYVVKTLKQDGYRVRVLARSEAKLSQPGGGLSPAIRDEVDEVFIGDVTKPETLTGLCDGIDYVFSSISLMGQKSHLTWHDVDYLGNKNILNEALAANVRKFIFVSVFNAEKVMNVPIVKAHEDFAHDLIASGMAYTIVRPTGFFSDLGAFLDMAQSGRCYLLGDGKARINPLHGADLARVCVDAIQESNREMNVGGPITYTWDEIAEIAFSAVGKPCRVTHLPTAIAKAGVSAVGLFNRHTADLWNFFVASSTLESVAPGYGTHKLSHYYADLAKQQT